MSTPASRYVVSSRQYPVILPEVEYPSGMTIRKVRHDGYIHWKGRMLYLCEALQSEPIGLDPLDDRHYALYYGATPLAILDNSTCELLPKSQAAAMLKYLREGEIWLL